MQVADGDLERLRAEIAELRRANSELTNKLEGANALLETSFDDNQRLGAALADERRVVTKLRGELEDLDRRSSMMASLYAAAYRLHGATRRTDVYAAIQDIIANIVGSEEMGIFDLKRGRLSLVSWVGTVPESFDDIEVGAGVIGGAVASGKTWVAGRGDDAPRSEASRVAACIPLCFEQHVCGAIAIFRLLPQKAAFEEGDYEIFDLLSTRAAAALECACAMASRAPTLFPRP